MFGLAGFMASSTINAAFRALTDSDTAVAFITEGAVVTSEGDIPTDRVAGVVGNFEMVCVTAMLAGGAILAASILRKYYK